jgi:hypothetical protein
VCVFGNRGSENAVRGQLAARNRTIGHLRAATFSPVPQVLAATRWRR